MSDRFNERAQSTPVPSRRAVVRSAAWAVPAVAAVSAAPAFAATQVCTKYPVSLALTSGSSQYNSARTTWEQTYTPAGASAAAIKISAAFTAPTVVSSEPNQMRTLSSFSDGNNRTFTTVTTGREPGVSGTTTGLNLAQRRGGGEHDTNNPTRHTGVWTFTFTRPVTNLRFTLSDIDNASGDFADRLYVLAGSGATASMVARGTNVRAGRLGTSADTYLDSTSNSGIDLTSTAGSAVYQFSGSTSSFSINYWNGLENAGSWNLNNDQQIVISGISFDYEVCV
ncbi:MAG: hypothetical protein ACI379_08555 [Nocardioides sp.]|uniref:hypothetical protein n=1 Tax=Nocardioides sp. TaxID=35761 RepID=UPI003F0F947D